VSAGTFTVPPYVLLALPPGNLTAFRFQPGDQGPATSSSFTAPGINFGLAQTFIEGISLFGFPVN
jgi:hypothetical protein